MQHYVIPVKYDFIILKMVSMVHVCVLQEVVYLISYCYKPVKMYDTGYLSQYVSFSNIFWSKPAIIWIYMHRILEWGAENIPEINNT